MQYHGASYAADVWDTYWYEKNLQGDVVAVYNQAGTKLVEYKYDAWGNTTVTYYNSGSSTTATKNPFRYRGYYYDVDLGLYYLQTRYYDANTGRFISPDTESVISATPDALTDKNLYAYCDNNPVMRRDDDGEFWNIIAGALIGVGSQLISDAVSSCMNGEWSFSHWTSYVGAAVGGAVGSLVPGSKVIGDVVGSAVSTILGMSGRNVVNKIQGKQSEYSDEEIVYTTMNNMMLTGLTSTVVRNGKHANVLEKLDISIYKVKLNVLDMAAGVFPAFVDGVRNSKSVSMFSKRAHGW